MRTLLRKNNRNEPCKSPSPDVAAKNIIKNTTIQVQDIRNKMKKAEEKEIKLDLQSSFSQITPSDNLSTDNKYKHIYDEYNKLKYQNKLLIDQNKQLNQENQRLTLQQQKNKNLGQLNSILLSKNENEVLREKIIIIDDEKKRLEKSLELERQKNQQSFKNIENLRLQLLFYKQKDIKGSKKVFVGNNQIQGRFIIFANNLLSSYEENTNKRIQQLGFKLNKIQMMQKIIKQQHSRITCESRVNKTPSSVKSYNWANTTVKVDSRQRENPLTHDRSDRQGQKSYNSPIQQHSKQESDSSVQRLQHENISLQQRIKAKQSEVQRLKIDKEKLAAVIHDLQFQRKALKISTPKFNNSDDNIFKKIVTLQETVGYYQKEAEKYQSQSIQLREHLTNLENQKLGKISEFQLKIRENLKDQNLSTCAQCKIKNKKILELEQEIKISKQDFDRSLIEVQGKFRNLIEDYDRKLEHSQSMGSEKFNVLDEQYRKATQLNTQMTQELANYKMMLDYVLAKIHVPSIEGLLKDNSSIYDDLESTFYHEREEYDKFITNATQQMLLKDQKIMQLEHSSQISKLQLKLLKQEIEHLKSINVNLQDNNVKIMKSNLNFMGRQKASKTQIFQKNNQQVIEMVRSGEEKLQILFQKINNYIHYDLVQSKII